jgi:hypothetical protein
VPLLFPGTQNPRGLTISFTAMASTVSKFTDNEIEAKVLVKSWQPQWKQLQLRFACSDDSEMACAAYDKAVTSIEQFEVDHIYTMTIPRSCVKGVKDTKKAAVENAQEVHINKPINWSLSKARWPTKVELPPSEISAAQEQDVFDIVGYVLEQEEADRLRRSRSAMSSSVPSATPA